ncbi:MAG: hypothetical protein GWN01_06130 [Nitrosopumilaceae archaeon]|nr:hypothetical protein [Nitrosopumilaceae archaeon]NIU00516.1 hypothetical protein [Nitrosopumilaceae archaeon]NIU86899.1 hypothetical protein [Nitrosopumilaceae archaeon]NIV65579.1 hypothetical protein [Nitrosopumilaceae archaeon]NIX61118.1 hypothetical protein [Nitrosopumilaceae archaeon]
MRSSGRIAVAFLLVTILSYGFSGVSFAQNPCPEGEVMVAGNCEPAIDEEEEISDFTLTTDSKLYSQGNTVKISGSVKEVEEGTAVGFKITDPDGNIVAIGQLTPKSDGTFSTQVLAEGPLWKPAGNYKIKANYGGLQANTVFEFAGGSGITPPSETKECDEGEILKGGECVPEIIECPTGQILVNGKCVDEEPKPQCGPNQDLINGQCIDKEPPPPPPPECEPGEILVDGECVVEEPPIECGEGTELVDGQCVPVSEPEQTGGGGCLIATAAFGSELAPQVQFLREVRDNTVMSTTAGASFMIGFNELYYSFSPTIADWERQNPIFKEGVRAFITPMISTLSIMQHADGGSDAEVLGLGISIIMLNLGIYLVGPTIIGFKVHKYLKSKRTQ